MRARARSSKSSGLSVMNVLLAGAVYGVARPYVANMIPDYAIGPVSTDNAVIGGLGYYASRKSGFIKALGLVAMGGEAGIVTAKAIGGVTGATGQTDAYVYK
jgi:hypothetical protein